MDGGKHIRAGVNTVKRCHPAGKEVVPGHDHRPQVLPVGNQEPDQFTQKECHRQKAHVAPERRAVPKQEIETHRNQQRIPETVGDHKELAEGNEPVEGYLRGPVAAGAVDQMLQDHKAHQIDRKPENVFQVMPAVIQHGGQTHGDHLT